MGLHDIGNDPQEKEPGGYGPRTQGVFHPSAGLHPDGGGCPRAVLFDLMHAQRSPTKILTNVLKSMDNGTARHAGMQKLFVHMAQKRLAGLAAVYQDVRLSHPPAAIGGSADMIVVMQSGAVYLIDIKTASPAKFKNLFKPAWNHVLQVNTYMGMAGVRTAYVLTEDRATLEFAKPNSKFRVDFSSTLWDETLGYCHGMLRTLRTERLPAHDEATCKSNLMFCDYEAVCVAERRGLAAFGVIDRRPAEVKKHHLRIIK
jgi:CRISPR/Cas system-associated exonuclease Cas4 (RecB family)